MRITPTVVETVAAHAEKFTGKAFRYSGTGGDIGHGARYFDGIMARVWVGRGASQEAAAYYIGGMLGWAQTTGREIPDYMREYCEPVQEAYQRNGKALQWEQEGRMDAKFRAADAAGTEG